MPRTEYRSSLGTAEDLIALVLSSQESVSKGSGESIKHPTDKTVTLTAEKRAKCLLIKTHGERLMPYNTHCPKLLSTSCSSTPQLFGSTIMQIAWRSLLWQTDNSIRIDLTAWK